MVEQDRWNKKNLSRELTDEEIKNGIIEYKQEVEEIDDCDKRQRILVFIEKLENGILEFKDIFYYEDVDEVLKKTARFRIKEIYIYEQWNCDYDCFSVPVSLSRHKYLEVFECVHNINPTKISTLLNGLETLKILRISSNCRVICNTNLSRKALKNKSKLRELSLVDMGLTKIPIYIDELKDLKTLNLNCNYISVIRHPIMKGRNSLIELSLSNNGISVLYEDAFEMLD